MKARDGLPWSILGPGRSAARPLHARGRGLERSLAFTWLAVLGLILLLAGCGGGGDDDPIPPAPTPPSPSSCQLAALPSPSYGTLLVDYLVFDLPASVVQLAAEVSTDGGLTFRPATAGLGGDGIANLFSSPTGTPHVFAWDLIADFPEAAQQNVDGVQLRLTTVEGDGVGAVAGTPCLSSAITVRGVPNGVLVGSLAMGLGQDGVHVPVSLTITPAAGGALHRLVIELRVDPAFLTVREATAGSGAAAATVSLTQIASDRMRIEIDSPQEPLLAGALLELVADSVCAFAPLPALTMVRCVDAQGFDFFGNPVLVACGTDGIVTVVNNAATVTIPDTTLSTGALAAPIGVRYAGGLPAAPADVVTFTLSWNAAELRVVAAEAGPSAPLAAVQLIGGAGVATITVTNPPGMPLADGEIARLRADVLAAAPSTALIAVGGTTLASPRCGSLPVGADPTAVITVSDQRQLLTLHAVSGVGARGVPALVPGTLVPRNPKGDWFPLGAGEFNATAALQAGGNPVLFVSPSDPPVQVVIEAGWSRAPVSTDTSAATNPDGFTTYSLLAGAGNLLISPSGMVTPLIGNSCALFRAVHTPNQSTAFGAPLSVDFAACVDLGGIDGATRSRSLGLGELDADLPGMPLGDPIPAAGGSFDMTVYCNTGANPVGLYEVRTTWNPARLDLQRMVGLTGYVGPSDGTLGGPDDVGAATPGESIASTNVATPGYRGIFDIWSMSMDVLTPGSSPIQHQVVSLNSSDLPPVAIGAPTPRVAAAASTAGITFP